MRKLVIPLVAGAAIVAAVFAGMALADGNRSSQWSVDFTKEDTEVVVTGPKARRVVVEFCDMSAQGFGKLGGGEESFRGSGENQGKPVAFVAITDQSPGPWPAIFEGFENDC